MLAVRLLRSRPLKFPLSRQRRVVQRKVKISQKIFARQFGTTLKELRISLRLLFVLLVSCGRMKEPQVLPVAAHPNGSTDLRDRCIISRRRFAKIQETRDAAAPNRGAAGKVQPAREQECKFNGRV